MQKVEENFRPNLERRGALESRSSSFLFCRFLPFVLALGCLAAAAAGAYDFVKRPGEW